MVEPQVLNAQADSVKYKKKNSVITKFLNNIWSNNKGYSKLLIVKVLKKLNKLIQIIKSLKIMKLF